MFSPGEFCMSFRLTNGFGIYWSIICFKLNEIKTLVLYTYIHEEFAITAITFCLGLVV